MSQLVFVGIVVLILVGLAGHRLARDGNNSEWWPGLLFLALFGAILVIGGLQ